MQQYLEYVHRSQETLMASYQYVCLSEFLFSMEKFMHIEQWVLKIAKTVANSIMDPDYGDQE